MKRGVRICSMCLLVAIEALVTGPATAQAEVYDPLTVSGRRSPDQLELVVNDAGRQRAIPILVYLPAQEAPAPVVLFSHGLGGSRHGSSYLGRHWSARGYVAVFIQHPGSDVSVWQDEPVRERLQALHRAANLQNTVLRVQDVPAVMDQLEAWDAIDGHALAGRMNLERIGMSGHSFGAVTTQVVSGQSAVAGLASFTDPRIKAAIAFSPSSPRRGRPERAFGRVTIPWMLMIGTQDTSPTGNADVASRLAMFPALPPGGKYELALDAAEHSAFTERALPGDTGPRNPNHHRAILALSTAFWDAWLRDDAAARAWLEIRLRKSRITAKQAVGLSMNGKWPAVGMSSRVALGMASAMATPPKVAPGSSAPYRTRVGASTVASSS